MKVRDQEQQLQAEYREHTAFVNKAIQYKSMTDEQWKELYSKHPYTAMAIWEALHYVSAPWAK